MNIQISGTIGAGESFTLSIDRAKRTLGPATAAQLLPSKEQLQKRADLEMRHLISELDGLTQDQRDQFLIREANRRMIIGDGSICLCGKERLESRDN